MKQKVYIAIDLKSFYASVECVERGLDPLDVNLVVADESRTDKTICLAATPAIKSFGVSGRSRLFEVKRRVAQVNNERRWKAPGRSLFGASSFLSELNHRPELAVDFMVAPPRMALYVKYSTQIYGIYLKYVAPEDIIVYSIDEVFMDVTGYLHEMSPREFAMKIILDVLHTTGITATAGIGTNLFLCKVAMDIVAKHIPADENGVRIAELDEMSFRKKLWPHRPLTDFWRIGRGYAKALEECGVYTMGDIARLSVTDEDTLYYLFGKNAELLIDHAWGWEPCTIADVKAYRPASNSLGAGQVLHCAYDAEKARLVLREMADQLALDLLSKRLMTDQIVVTVGYDIENLTKPEIRSRYHGPVTKDHYGRQVPKHAHGTYNLDDYTSSAKKITAAASDLFDRIADKNLLVRRLNIVAAHVMDEASAPRKADRTEQLDFFTDYEAVRQEQQKEDAELEKERRMQEAVLSIKQKFGKNALLKGFNLEEGATAIDRNNQIGGHKA
jgi:DNA polymerase V